MLGLGEGIYSSSVLDYYVTTDIVQDVFGFTWKLGLASAMLVSVWYIRQNVILLSPMLLFRLEHVIVMVYTC